MHNQHSYSLYLMQAYLILWAKSQLDQMELGTKKGTLAGSLDPMTLGTKKGTLARSLGPMELGTKKGTLAGLDPNLPMTLGTKKGTLAGSMGYEATNI